MTATLSPERISPPQAGMPLPVDALMNPRPQSKPRPQFVICVPTPGIDDIRLVALSMLSVALEIDALVFAIVDSCEWFWSAKKRERLGRAVPIMGHEIAVPLRTELIWWAYPDKETQPLWVIFLGKNQSGAAEMKRNILPFLSFLDSQTFDSGVVRTAQPHAPRESGLFTIGADGKPQDIPATEPKTPAIFRYSDLAIAWKVPWEKLGEFTMDSTLPADAVFTHA